MSTQSWVMFLFPIQRSPRDKMAEKVTLDRDAVIEALRHLDVLVSSLDRIGSATSSMSEEEHRKILADFVFDWDVTRRIIRIRRILSEPFGDDELEQLFDDVETWRLDQRKPSAG